jgi:hypothetical protein
MKMIGVITMMMTSEQKRKYNIFTVQLAALLTVIRDERTEVKYFVRGNGTEIVDILDNHGTELVHMDVTSMQLISAVNAIMVMLK